MHWELPVLEWFGDIFSIPHSVMTSIYRTPVKQYDGIQASSSIVKTRFRSKDTYVLQVPRPSGARSEIRGNIKSTGRTSSYGSSASILLRRCISMWRGETLRRRTHLRRPNWMLLWDGWLQVRISMSIVSTSYASRCPVAASYWHKRTVPGSVGTTTSPSDVASPPVSSLWSH